MVTIRIFVSILFGCIWAVNDVPGVSASLLSWDDVKPIRINATFGTQCQEPHECDTDRNQYCDIIDQICQCIPYSAYDQIAGECRRIACGPEYNSTMNTYVNLPCPVGFKCFNSQTCTRLCQNDNILCKTKPDVDNREDMTYVYAFYIEMAFVGVLLFVALNRYCLCKPLQHPDAFDDVEDPNKNVICICYCIPSRRPRRQSLPHLIPMNIPITNLPL